MTWPKFKKAEEVPEQFKDLYEEKDGEWVVKDAGDGSGAAKALQVERDARKAAEKEAKDLKASIDETKSAMQKLQDQIDAGKVGKSTDELEKMREKMRTDLRREFDVQLTDLEKKVKELEGAATENRQLKLDHKVKNFMGKEGARSDRIDALFRLTQEEYDLGDDGNLLLKNHPGKAVEIFIRDDLKKQYPEFFEGTKASGGGAGGGKGGDLPQGGTTADDVLRDPVAAINAHRAAGGK